VVNQSGVGTKSTLRGQLGELEARRAEPGWGSLGGPYCGKRHAHQLGGLEERCTTSPVPRPPRVLVHVGFFR